MKISHLVWEHSPCGFGNDFGFSFLLLVTVEASAGCGVSGDRGGGRVLLKGGPASGHISPLICKNNGIAKPRPGSLGFTGISDFFFQFILFYFSSENKFFLWDEDPWTSLLEILIVEIVFPGGVSGRLWCFRLLEGLLV